ncbi:MAG: hypothetical protein KAY37_11780 [Phycisphaerae bacterium]|nr:hypothetical protein [Phycisphaerae bacterium]
MLTPNIEDTDPARLAELLPASDREDKLWEPEELGGVLRHQLAAPIEFDLGGVYSAGTEARPTRVEYYLKQAASSPGPELNSFAELLYHPSPPVELLRLTKQFAKAHRNQPHSPLPREVSTILYFASIAAALVRCQKRISELEDAALRDGFKWSRDQSWVDAALRALFADGLKLLS